MKCLIIIDCFLRRRREGRRNPVGSRSRRRSYRSYVPEPYEFTCVSPAQHITASRIRETSKERRV